MSRRCPECGQGTPPGIAPGKVYACPRCANPVLAGEHAPARGRAGAASGEGGGGGGGRVAGGGRRADGPSPGAPSTPGGAAARAPWRLALLAFVVLGAAYVGAYELLTAEAQRDRAKLLAAHGDKLATYPKPDGTTSGDAKALREYVVARSLYEDRQRFEACEARISAGRLGMAVAFGAQTLFAVIAFVRWRAARARAARAGEADVTSRA